MPAKKGKVLQPLYFLIPYAIATDKELAAIDSYVYGTLYWFGKLRNRRCTASNKTIAKATKDATEHTVEKSLTRLERRGYIQRLFYDESRRHRKEILCLLIVKEEKISSHKKEKKPYYNGCEMRQTKADGKWWVIKDGKWLEYVGKKSEIEWQ